MSTLPAALLSPHQLTSLGCGNSVENGGGPAPDGDAHCNMKCNGNSSESCGGPNRLDVYSSTSSPSTTSSSTPTGTPESNGKRGLAYNNDNPSANAEYANLFKGYSKVSWGYDWGYPSWDLDASFEFVCVATHLRLRKFVGHS